MAACSSQIGLDGFKALARNGAELWARFGFTTAEEGRSIPQTAEVLRQVADEGGFAIDVVTYPDVLVDRDWIAANVSDTYTNRFRVAGAKLTIDGSPQGFTAWRDRPYVDPVGNYPPGYVGYPAATSEQVIGAVVWAYANGIQIITHSNGEAASDLLLAAHATAQTARGGVGDLRPVLIHGQFLREDQVDRMNQLGITPSLFPMHTFYWGDWHREHTVGPALVDDISPTGWVAARGMRFSHPYRCAGGVSRCDAGARCHGDAALAVGRHHRTGTAGGRDDRAQGDDALAGLASPRGCKQGLDRGGQARRSGDPVGGPDGGGPRDARHAGGGRDHQGRCHGLRGGQSRMHGATRRRSGSSRT